MKVIDLLNLGISLQLIFNCHLSFSIGSNKVGGKLNKIELTRILIIIILKIYKKYNFDLTISEIYFLLLSALVCNRTA